MVLKMTNMSRILSLQDEIKRTEAKIAKKEKELEELKRSLILVETLLSLEAGMK